MSEKFYFRSRSNPTAPLLVLEHYWEARDMRGHPDYDRVDEEGFPIVDEESKAPETIPVVMARAKKG